MELSLTGQRLVDDSLLNKSSAFPEEERRELGLMVLIPLHTSTIEGQLARVMDLNNLEQTVIRQDVGTSIRSTKVRSPLSVWANVTLFC